MIMIEVIPELVNPEKVSFIRHQIVHCIKTGQTNKPKALQGGDFPFRPERPILEGRAGMRGMAGKGRRSLLGEEPEEDFEKPQSKSHEQREQQTLLNVGAGEKFCIM